MNGILLTVDEAATLAYIDLGGTAKRMLDENAILIAQLTFLKPALGEMYDALTEGRYAEFNSNYLKLPLALWVKSALMQNSRAKLSSMGITRESAEYIKPAPEKEATMAINALKGQARLLLRNALEYLAENRKEYPEYKPLTRRRLRRIEAGIIL